MIRYYSPFHSLSPPPREPPKAILVSQQFVILSKENSSGEALAPIGSRDEILQILSNYNTSPECEGDETLFGPGIRIEFTPGQDPVTQMLMSIEEEEIAWLVVMRLAKELNWRILDPETGRELNG